MFRSLDRLQISELSDAQLQTHYNSVASSGLVHSLLAMHTQFPLTEQVISELYADGWKVSRGAAFACKRLERSIDLRKGSIGYERDVGLLHEILHAHLGVLSRDDDGFYLAPENRVIIEKLARSYRQRPAILRASVLSWKLVPYIYDDVSQIAFKGFRAKRLEFEPAVNFLRTSYGP